MYGNHSQDGPADLMTSRDPHIRYPEITVELSGQEGNAFMVLGLEPQLAQSRSSDRRGRGVLGRGDQRRLRPVAPDLHAMGERRVTRRPGKHRPT